jgi:hypothetical protein
MPKRKGGFDSSYLAGVANTQERDIFGDLPSKQHLASLEDTSGYPRISIALLHDNPYQPRHTMDEERLNALAQEIREHGFKGVVLARHDPADAQAYQLVYGHRWNRQF